MEADIDPFPDGFLEKLARVGVNGVWLQAVLRTLAPSKIFPEFGEGWETRLEESEQAGGARAELRREDLPVS